MHLRSFVVENFGPIRKLSWDPGEVTAGWHVFIGDNGAGKSTLLKALSLAMVGDNGARGLRVKPSTLVRRGSENAVVKAQLSNNSSGKYSPGDQHGILSETSYHAAFGPIRRYTGGDKKAANLLDDYPEVARHLPLFDHTWEMTGVIRWLKDLQLDHQEPGRNDNRSMGWVQGFLNYSGLLPYGVQLVRVTSAGPIFTDSTRNEFSFHELSDGYQSALGLTLEILRQIFSSAARNTEIVDDHGHLSVETNGIVLIDEIDAHLHPTWQQRIGGFFTKHFPNMQFLVTTHSPLICRAAVNGSIFRLPRPDDLDDEGGMVTGVDRGRLIFGDVLDAYGTEVFGSGITRSEDGRKKLERLGELNVRVRFGQVLEEGEQIEQRALQAIFTQAPLSPEDL